MAEETVEAQVTLPEAGAMIQASQENNDALQKYLEGEQALVATMQELLDVMKSNGGRYNDDGTTSGANSTAIVKRGGEDTAIQTIKDLFGDGGEASNAGTKLAKLGDATDALSEVLGGGRATGLTQVLKNAKGGLGGLTEMLEGVGGAGGVTRALGAFGGALAVAVTAIELNNKAMDTMQQAKDVAVSQTGSDQNMLLGAEEWTDVQMRSTFSPLSEQDAQAIQQNLIAGRARFGTDEYYEGMEFASAARLNYSMDAGSAAKLYTDAVVKGTASTEDLTRALDNMAKIAGETNTTMTEMIGAYEQSIQKLENAFPGQGERIASDIAASVGSSEQYSALANMAAKYGGDMQYGSMFTQLMNEYGTRYSPGDAAALASIDLLKMGYMPTGAKDIAWLTSYPLSDEGKTFLQYLNEKDFGGMRAALEDMQKNRAGDYSVFLGNLEGIGIDISTVNTPESIVSTFGGISDYTPPSGDVKNADEEMAEAGYTSADYAAEYGAVQEDYLMHTSSGYDVYAMADAEKLSAAAQEGAAKTKADTSLDNAADYTNLSEQDRYALLNRLSASDRQKMKDVFSKEAQMEVLDTIGEMYAQSAWTDYGIDTYLSKNTDAVSQVIDKYSSYISKDQTGKEQQKVLVDVHLSFEDDMGRFVYEKFVSTSTEDARNSGSD